MPSFFSLPQDVLTQVYVQLPPENLLRMLTTGSFAVKDKTVIRSLFMKRDNQSKRLQEKVIQSWDQSHGIYPFPFTDPHHNEFSRALTKLDVRHQIMGLYLMNKPAHAGQTVRSQPQNPDTATDLPHQQVAITPTAPQKRVLDEVELSAHIIWIDANLMNRNSKVSRQARQALITLAQEIDDNQLPLLFALIQKKLESLNEYSKQYQTVLNALTIIAPKLKETQLTHFLIWIQKKLESLYESEDDEDMGDEDLIVHRVSWDEEYRHLQDALNVIAPYFQETHLKSFLNWIQKKLINQDMDFDVQKALTTLATQLPQRHITQFFAWIQINLAHWNAGVRINAHEALAAVAARLDPKTISTHLIDLIKNHLNSDNDSLRASAQRTLIALAPKLDETHIAILLAWIEDNLKLGDNEIRNALYALAAIGSTMSPKDITATRFKQVKDHLNHPNLAIRVSAQQALVALAPRLSEEFITADLLDSLHGNLELDTRIGALEVLEALASRLNSSHLSPALLDFVQQGLLSSQYLLRNGAQNGLIALIPVMNEQQINGFLDWIQTILEQPEARMKADVLQTLTIIVSELDNVHLSPRLMTLIQSNLLETNHLALHAQEVLSPLVPKLDEPGLALFFDWMQNNLGKKLKPEPYLGDLLACCAVDNEYAIPIAKKLVSIINGKNRSDSAMALNLLGQWSMSWIQYLDITNKDTINDLIASLQPNVYDKNKTYAPNKTWNMFARLSDHDINPNPYLLSLLREQLQQFVGAPTVTSTVQSHPLQSS